MTTEQHITEITKALNEIAKELSIIRILLSKSDPGYPETLYDQISSIADSIFEIRGQRNL